MVVLFKVTKRGQGGQFESGVPVGGIDETA